jgi:hypothetical protein
MVTAVIYCNEDGIFNDDKYDYETVGFPFMPIWAKPFLNTNWKGSTPTVPI